MLKAGDRIGIVCCSDGQKHSDSRKIKYLGTILRKMGFFVCFSDCIYETESGFGKTAGERARALMQFYKDSAVKGIFDISGGDLANGILPYLDYDVIANSEKVFWGYSDLTAVINAVYAKTGKASVLYQICNLVKEPVRELHSMEEVPSMGKGHLNEKRFTEFQNSVIKGTDDLFRINYRFLQQKEMRGTVVGGNIRCFLKLAGTEFMPDLQGKILLLESRSGTAPRIEAYLRQLQQLGAFKKAAGILLGTFTQMTAEKCIPTVETLLCEIAGKELPIAVTPDVGHGVDAKGIVIGEELRLGT